MVMKNCLLLLLLLLLLPGSSTANCITTIANMLITSFVVLMAVCRNKYRSLRDVEGSKSVDSSSSPCKLVMSEKDAASKKKADKKARRAAKVQQKEASEQTPTEKSGKAADGAAPGSRDKVTDQSAAASSGQGESEKKKLSKAERRELQEKQRQAKAAKAAEADQGGKQKPEEKKESSGNVHKEKATPKSEATPAKPKQLNGKSSKSSTPAKVGGRIFLSHLPPYRNEPPTSKSYIHPAISRIGLQYAKGVICGSNARAVALLCALKQVVEDYVTPEHKELCRDLHDKVKLYMDYLQDCRPISVSMDSINKYLTPIILSCRSADPEAKRHLLAELDRFYKERIYDTDDEIVKKSMDKIVKDDVIVTYGHSSLVLKVLIAAVRKHPSVSVIVVDSRPKFEGKEMVRKLLNCCPSASCSYVLVNSVSYVMPRATKVLLGAHAVLANGYIMSRVGTSQIALMAKAYNVPVLVCCETYKFSHKMQTDSFVANELGDEAQMVNINSNSPGPLAELKDKSNLHVLNLCYDVTPPDYVTGLITETAVIPCTSAPVVNRVKQQYNLMNVKT